MAGKPRRLLDLLTPDATSCYAPWHGQRGTSIEPPRVTPASPPRGPYAPWRPARTWWSGAAAALALAAIPALAQPGGSPATARSRHIAERAQLGLVEYCQAQGWAGADAVARQRQTVAALPPAPGLGDAEEAAGRNGVIAFDGPQASFADDAQAKGITLKANCEYLIARLR